MPSIRIWIRSSRSPPEKDMCSLAARWLTTGVLHRIEQLADRQEDGHFLVLGGRLQFLCQGPEDGKLMEVHIF